MASAYEDKKKYYQQAYFTVASGGRVGRQEEIRTTPLFSLAVKHHVDYPEDEVSTSSGSDSTSDSIDHEAVLPQYGLLGFHVGDSESISEKEPIMLNVNAPNSVFICGSQGSGKSYTLSTMLENCLMNDDTVGSISQPVAGVVFHYDVDSSSSIAEVAHLCSRGIEVNVLVSQSNEHALRRAYEHIGPQNNKPKVRPLLLRSSDLSVDRMNKLMALAEKEGPPPLYMEIIQRILRRMAIENTASTGFDYKHFRSLLDQEFLSREQLAPMNLRFSLLESFMHPGDLPFRPTETWRPKPKNKYKLFDLKPGSLTIVDLSDTFIDAATVCLLFDICLGLVKAQRPTSGLIIALDEAHKFMNDSSGAKSFTAGLLTTIREQRHNATRVVIATQEPTISTDLLDLCSVSMVHRFTSPAWFAAIRGHLGGASKMLKDGEEIGGIFERIVELNVGESLVFCPGAFVKIVADEEGENKKVGKLGPTAMKMKTRKRMGNDGGMSVLASG
ncbi:hypothetical protein CERZMDRAFT_41612 [Cercospora zeae-maydis SCOH1-5]|uniref:AAA+ ATPase domain-containing protein n=1 Tax=Cercospora zeae-maydis SCOH1-5 TaxID=717836 RepID=A0A6A6FFU1_9PEZI|nr:hypothetical protein CERZMDRAFT_41612 [Cercospora zeae-maydis SCOH1-5]